MKTWFRNVFFIILLLLFNGLFALSYADSISLPKNSEIRTTIDARTQYTSNGNFTMSFNAVGGAATIIARGVSQINDHNGLIEAIIGEKIPPFMRRPIPISQGNNSFPVRMPTGRYIFTFRYSEGQATSVTLDSANIHPR